MGGVHRVGLAACLVAPMSCVQGRNKSNRAAPRPGCARLCARGCSMHERRVAEASPPESDYVVGGSSPPQQVEVALASSGPMGRSVGPMGTGSPIEQRLD